MATGKILIYGGRGALGSVCVLYFKSKNFWVGSIDINPNTEADSNILVEANKNFTEQADSILDGVNKVLLGEKLDAVITVAGGWAGGNAASSDFIKNCELVWKQSVWSSVIASRIAALHLKEGGLLTLTGAKAAQADTPGMIGYGMAKAAVHQLTKSLSSDESGLPKQAEVFSILPVTLDTPMNRKWMPKADFSTWTSLEFVAELFYKWTTKKERPLNGSLVQLITKDSKTELIFN